MAKHLMNTHHLAAHVPQDKTPASHYIETTTLRAQGAEWGTQT